MRLICALWRHHSRSDSQGRGRYDGSYQCRPTECIQACSVAKTGLLATAAYQSKDRIWVVVHSPEAQKLDSLGCPTNPSWANEGLDLRDLAEQARDHKERNQKPFAKLKDRRQVSPWSRAVRVPWLVSRADWETQRKEGKTRFDVPKVT